MTNHVKPKLVRNRIEVVAAACVALLASTASAETEPKYTLNVISDAAAGHEILAGRYEEAIATLDPDSGGAADRFFAANNLCVALIKAAEFDSASKTCDLAIELVDKRVFAGRSVLYGAYSDGTYKKYLAMALSNRGVLRALMGDTALALEDFVAAAELDTRVPSPEINMARLEISMSGRA